MEKMVLRENRKMGREGYQFEEAAYFECVAFYFALIQIFGDICTFFPSFSKLWVILSKIPALQNN